MAPKKVDAAAKAAAKAKAAPKSKTVKDSKIVKDPWASEPKAKAKAKPQASKDGGALPTAALKRMAGHLAYRINNANLDIKKEAEEQKAVYDSASHAQKLEILSRFEQEKNTKFLSTFVTTKGSGTKDKVKIRSGWMSKCPPTNCFCVTQQGCNILFDKLVWCATSNETFHGRFEIADAKKFPLDSQEFVNYLETLQKRPNPDPDLEKCGVPEYFLPPSSAGSTRIESSFEAKHLQGTSTNLTAKAIEGIVAEADAAEGSTDAGNPAEAKDGAIQILACLEFPGFVSSVKSLQSNTSSMNTALSGARRAISDLKALPVEKKDDSYGEFLVKAEEQYVKAQDFFESSLDYIAICKALSCNDADSIKTQLPKVASMIGECMSWVSKMKEAQRACKILLSK